MAANFYWVHAVQFAICCAWCICSSVAFCAVPAKLVKVDSSTNVGSGIARDRFEIGERMMFSGNSRERIEGRKLVLEAARMGNGTAMHTIGVDFVTRGKVVSGERWLRRALHVDPNDVSRTELALVLLRSAAKSRRCEAWNLLVIAQISYPPARAVQNAADKAGAFVACRKD